MWYGQTKKITRESITWKKNKSIATRHLEHVHRLENYLHLHSFLFKHVKLVSMKSIQI